MKRTAIDHPKLKRLTLLLGIPHYAAVGIAECLWQFTAKHAIQGDIGKWSNVEIALAIGWPTEDADKLIDVLASSKLVDKHSRYRLVVHDWHDHCDDSTKKTLRNRGMAFATFPEDSGIVATIPEKYSTVAEKEGTSASAISDNALQPFRNFPEDSGNGSPKPEPKPSQSLSLAKPEPQPAGGGRIPEKFDIRQKQWGEFMGLYPLNSDGRYTAIEEGRGQFHMLADDDVVKIFQAVKHYAASDTAKRGRVMGLGRFVGTEWLEWVAPPRAGPAKQQQKAATIPKNWHK